MKRMKYLMVLVLLVVFPVVAAFTTVYMAVSKGKTADALIYTGAGYLYGFTVTTDGTNTVTVAVHDDTTNGVGTKLIKDTVVTTSSSNREQWFGFDPPLPFNTGIYVDITVGGGGSVTYDVFYRAQR